MARYSYPWHTDSCERSQEYTDKNGVKHFFCKTHGQWAEEIPVKTETIFTYEDGSTISRIREVK